MALGIACAPWRQYTLWQWTRPNDVTQVIITAHFRPLSLCFHNSYRERNGLSLAATPGVFRKSYQEGLFPTKAGSKEVVISGGILYDHYGLV